MTEQLKKLRKRRLRRCSQFSASHGADVISPVAWKNMRGRGVGTRTVGGRPTPQALSHPNPESDSVGPESLNS